MGRGGEKGRGDKNGEGRGGEIRMVREGGKKKQRKEKGREGKPFKIFFNIKTY